MFLVLKVHLFHVTPIVMQPLEIHENSVKQNIVNDTNIENAYDHNELLKNDHLGPKEKVTTIKYITLLVTKILILEVNYYL